MPDALREEGHPIGAVYLSRQEIARRVGELGDLAKLRPRKSFFHVYQVLRFAEPARVKEMSIVARRVLDKIIVGVEPRIERARTRVDRGLVDRRGFEPAYAPIKDWSGRLGGDIARLRKIAEQSNIKPD